MKYQTRLRLRDQIRRRGGPLLFAAVLWSVWALATYALNQWFPEDGLLIALFLLGGIVSFGCAYATLWLRRFLRQERQQEAKQLQELTWLSAVIQPRRPFPAYVGAMAAPALLTTAWQLIREERPQRILELGSGLSSLVMAYALAANGQGKLFALEDNPHYAENSRRSLAEHQQTGRARVIDAPLFAWEIGGEIHPWYSLTKLSTELPFDFLFVDGPAGYLAPYARYPALPLLREYLAAGAIIIFDDTERAPEQQIVQRWLAEFPDIRPDDRYSGAGFSVFRIVGPP